MGWIDDRLPPEGLHVLCEISCMGTDEHGVTVYADHDFFIGFYLTPEDEKEGRWFVEYNGTFYDPTVHAWMPLPKHYAPQEMFTQEPDLMEHAMFEDDPEWLYKGDAVYEQMSIDDFLREAEHGKEKGSVLHLLSECTRKGTCDLHSLHQQNTGERRLT